MSSRPYHQDLAYIHNVGFGNFAERSAPGILQILRQAGIRNGLVIDLGCGGGLWARRLVHAGYHVLGFDISPHMIALARQHVPEATFRKDSFLDVSFPECVVITALGEVLNYLFDRRNRRSALRRLFRRAYSALQPGGLLIFDVAGSGRASDSTRRFWTGPDWACLVEYTQDHVRNLLTRHMTTFRKVARAYRRDEEIHVQQLYEAPELADDLRAIGFRVSTAGGYGRFQFPNSLVALIAQKPRRTK